ncbi:MAG: CHAT domain-containing protein [Vicinamibacteria bacterium]|nr:CHAT domain-containing protein [Vicinamibacteria bacterium]
MRGKARFNRLVALMLFLMTTACHESQEKRCRRMIEEENHQAAIQACTRAFEAERDSEVGALAAEAHLELNHHAQVEEWLARLRGSSEEARAWELAAISRRRRDRTDPARRAYLRAVEQYQAKGREKEAALNLYRLFHLSWEKSRYRDALIYVARTLDIAAETGDIELSALGSEGLFALLIDVGDLEGARRALAIMKDSATLQTTSGRAKYLANTGLIYLNEGRAELARYSFEQALTEAERAGESEILRIIHLNLVDVNVQLERTAAALTHLEAAERHADPYGRNRVALHYFRAIVERARGDGAAAAMAIRDGLRSDPPDEWAWDLEYQSGLLEEGRGNDSAAEQAFERSCRILERMRSNLGFGEFKSWHLERKRGPFEALFLQQVRRKHDLWKALETAERVRARVFVDAIATRGMGTKSDESPIDLMIESAADRIDTLQGLIPALSESFAGVLMTSEQMAQSIGKHHALAYFKAGEWLWLMRVSAAHLDARRLSLPADEIRVLVERFVASPDDQSLAAKLGMILLPEDVLPGTAQDLLVITDTLLDRVPFAALRLKNGYLVERHAIIHSPSLNAFNAIEGDPRVFRRPPVVLGDPLGNLPAAAREARDVARLLDVTAHVGSDATAAMLIDKGRDSSVLHLATHGEIGPRGPQIRLSDRPIAADEIIRSGVASRLVVLASCASATRSARGIASPMAAAFLAAGSRAVVASLWSFPDSSSRRFLIDFYKKGGARDPARALARSQRGFIETGEPPSFWSAFVMMGSRAVSMSSIRFDKQGEAR